jgi:hypothetical protein
MVKRIGIYGDNDEKAVEGGGKRYRKREKSCSSRRGRWRI